MSNSLGYITVSQLKAEIKNLPDNAEVLIPAGKTLYSVTGLEISFFNCPSNKHIKLTSDLSEDTSKLEARIKALEEALEYQALVNHGYSYLAQAALGGKALNERQIEFLSWARTQPKPERFNP